MKRRLSLSVAACAVACGILPVRALEIASETMRVFFVDGAQYYKGTVTGIVSSTGRAYSSGGKIPLFSVEMRRLDCFTNVMKRTAHHAGRMVSASSDGELKLEFSEFGSGLEKVVCRIDGNGGDGKLRWRIAVTPKEGLAVTEVAYPQIDLDCPIGRSGCDDRLFACDKSRTVKCNPGETLDHTKWKEGGVHANQPGGLFAPFCGYYDGEGGLYSATEDTRFHAKRLDLYRTACGVRLAWLWMTWKEGVASPDYAVVTACFAGRDGQPASWYDAADIYRDWARKQFWCKTPQVEKTFLPEWMRDAPSMVRFTAQWHARPDSIRRWIDNFWKRHFPKSPLLAVSWGWEKHGKWVTPDYFPLHPDDATFAEGVRAMAENDIHFFPWPSSLNWTYTFREEGSKLPPGEFDYETKAAFEKMSPLAVRNVDGSFYSARPFWYNGGEMRKLCPGDVRVRDWWVREIAEPLLSRGAEALQFDQLNGGHTPPCYDLTHGHAPGYGLWQAESVRSLIEAVSDAARKRNVKLVISLEDPNELYLDKVGVQHYHPTETEIVLTNCMFASVWNYLYHEFVATFPSSPVSEPWTAAYCAADGQIPYRGTAHFGQSEDTEGRWGRYDFTKFWVAWTRMYHQEGRMFLAHGRQIRPPQISCARTQIAIKRNEGDFMFGVPAVCHAAYESLDGKQRAVVFANGTGSHQDLEWHYGLEDKKRLSLAPYEIRLVRLDSSR